MTRRGEIYWFQLSDSTGSEQSGTRPVLIIQNDAGNQYSPTTIIAAITSQPRGRQYPFHVPFTPEESGLRVSGIILCEQIRTVHQGRLEALAGSLSPQKMQEVDTALHRSLGLEN